MIIRFFIAWVSFDDWKINHSHTKHFTPTGDLILDTDAVTLDLFRKSQNPLLLHKTDFADNFDKKKPATIEEAGEVLHIIQVEKRGGKSKHFEADLYELLTSNDCIDSRYKKIINID